MNLLNVLKFSATWSFYSRAQNPRVAALLVSTAKSSCFKMTMCFKTAVSGLLQRPIQCSDTALWEVGQGE